VKNEITQTSRNIDWEYSGNPVSSWGGMRFSRLAVLSPPFLPNYQKLRFLMKKERDLTKPFFQVTISTMMIDIVDKLKKRGR